MKMQFWGLTAALLVVSTLSLEAGEKLYRIRLTAANGKAMGKPVSFQEVVPAPAPDGHAQGIPTPASPAPAPGLQPIPEPIPGGVPGLGFGSAPYQTVELYHRVKYEDLDNVHPCAVKKIVAVKDPCEHQEGCGTCAPQCVYVMICVPPCDDNFEYKVKRKDGSKVKYDYGKYEIEIISKDGVVTVDYDDSAITRFVPFLN